MSLTFCNFSVFYGQLVINVVLSLSHLKNHILHSKKISFKAKKHLRQYLGERVFAFNFFIKSVYIFYLHTFNMFENYVCKN
ncbi:hypothetical protein SAMN04487979_11916 [Flavobacterium sp. ov086]|nr:hypothetical protein SAMN04487979_11916 [Flavobacterium sp. ov086]